MRFVEKGSWKDSEIGNFYVWFFPSSSFIWQIVKLENFMLERTFQLHFPITR